MSQSVLDSKILPNSAPLRDISLWNLNDLDIALSNVIVQMDIPYNAFVLMFNGNIWPNFCPFTRYKLQNPNDFDTDLSMSLRLNTIP